MLSVLRHASRSFVSMPRRGPVSAVPLHLMPQFRTLISVYALLLTCQPMSNIVLAKRYTIEHETVSYDDTTGLGTITITEHAQSSLGDVVFVELPALGTKVAQGGKLFMPSKYACSREAVNDFLLPNHRPNWGCGKCKGCFGYR